MKLPNVEMIGFADQVFGLSPSACWLSVGKNPRPAESTCSALSTPDTQIAWVEEQLRRAGVKESCYIALSCVGPLPWFELRLPKGHRGFAIYWTNLLIKGALINGESVVLLLHAQEGLFSARTYRLQDLVAAVSPS